MQGIDAQAAVVGERGKAGLLTRSLRISNRKLREETGFELADGRRISVLRDWQGRPQDAAFLRAARDAACRVFSTVLSPDYNAAHRDHLHLDTANRGPGGWRACR